MDMRKAGYVILINFIVAGIAYGFAYLRIKEVMEDLDIENIDMIVDPGSTFSSIELRARNVKWG